VLDRFAVEGTRFATCIAAAPWTPPSHVSMLTGLYPAHHGIRNVGYPLQPGVRLLSERLRERGFRTAAIVASDIVLPDARCRAGFEHYQEIPWRRARPTPGPEVLNTGADVTAAATAWLEGLASDDPFFLFLHYYDVHSDYAPEPRVGALLGASPNLEPGSTSFLVKWCFVVAAVRSRTRRAAGLRHERGDAVRRHPDGAHPALQADRASRRARRALRPGRGPRRTHESGRPRV
jgi:hypothetical protein